jgi:regulator of nucleoside diphosphate kinase
MLGYRVNNEFEWKVPEGVRRMRVTRVHYQPEAAGNFER